MFTLIFWKDTLERATRNASTSFIAIIGADTVMLDLGWEAILGIPATAAILEIAVSLSTVGLGQNGTAGIVNTVPSTEETPP